MCDDPQGGDSDDTGAGRNPSGPADETVEGIGGDPFPGADQAPPPSAAGSRIEGIPEGWQAQDDGAADAPAFEPLAARPEGSGTRSPGAGEGEDSASHASQVQIGTGHSGIFSPSDILSEASSAGMRSARSRWILAEDGSDLEEPAAPPAEADDPPGVPPASEGPADPDEWRDMQPTAPDEAASESIGFSAFLASTEGAEQPGTGDSLAGDSQGIGESTLEGLDLGAGATEARRAAPRDDGGAMRRQLIGVILGGMLALPVTQVILLWGFQRDPFQVTRHVPAGLRFLLPSKFRGSPRRDDGRATAPRAGLDSLAATVPDEPAAADGADGSTCPPWTAPGPSLPPIPGRARGPRRRRRSSSSRRRSRRFARPRRRGRSGSGSPRRSRPRIAWPGRPPPTPTPRSSSPGTAISPKRPPCWPPPNAGRTVRWRRRARDSSRWPSASPPDMPRRSNRSAPCGSPVRRGPATARSSWGGWRSCAPWGRGGEAR